MDSFEDLDPFKNSSSNPAYDMLSQGDQLVHDLLSLYRSQIKTDVTLVVQSKEYKVHRLILSTRSKYFSKLFEEHPDQHRIELDEPFNLVAFEHILEYIYGGQIMVNTSNIDTLAAIAEKFRLKKLCRLLGSFYGTELTGDNVVKKLVHYHKTENKRAVQQCLLYIDHIFTTNYRLEKELLELPFEILIQIVQRKTLDSTESRILKLLVEWHSRRVDDLVDSDILQKQMQQLSAHLNLFLLCLEDPMPLFNVLRPNGWVTDVELLWNALTTRVSAGDIGIGRAETNPMFMKRKPAPKISKKKKEAFKVAILGLPRAGKTSVMKYFLRKTHPDLQTTTIMVEEFEFEGNTVQLRDFNAEDAQKLWYSEVNKGIDGLIWVIDATNLLEENIDAINNIMDFVGQKDLPVLILAHKSDINTARTDDVISFLRITRSVYFSLAKRTILDTWHIVSSNMNTPGSLDDGMKWLLEKMIENTLKRKKHGVISRAK